MADTPLSHTLRSDFHYETYIGISPYRTLAVVELQSMEIMEVMTWSCEKMQTLFIFRAIKQNTAHVQWIRCSPKGSHLINWASAVFSHIALKWTPFAYLIHSLASVLRVCVLSTECSSRFLLLLFYVELCAFSGYFAVFRSCCCGIAAWLVTSWVW